MKMSRANSVLLAVLLLVGAAGAEEGAATRAATRPVVKLDPADAAAVAEAKGKDAIVEGRVQKASWGGTGKVMRASFDNGKLNVVVFERDRKAMDEAFGGDVAKALQGAKVRVTGTVDEYRGRAEIKVTKPEQLKIVEAAKAQPEAPAIEAEPAERQ